MKIKVNLLKTISAVLISVLFAAGGFAQSGSGEFKLPKYQKYTLDNGLTIYLLEQHEVPLIYVSAVFPAGAVRDGSNYGLANLVADNLLYGSKNYTKDQIEEAFDFLGADISSYASLEYAGMNLSFNKKDADKLLPVFKDIIINPVFPKEEFDKRKQRLILELAQEKESPGSVIRKYYNKFLFGESAYGNPVSGTKLSVEGIKVNDLKSFYNKFYNPAQSAIAVVGDFNSKEMKAKLSGLFAGWKPSGNVISAAEVGEISKPGEARVLMVNKDDSHETTFYIGSLGIKRSNPDYVAIQVVNTILGGRFTSWLNDELRVNAGLTYGARSYFIPYKHAGTFMMYSFTRTATTIEAIDLALEVLNRLHTKGIDEKTLISAKNYMKGQFPPKYETSGELANLLTQMFVYDFDESYINNFEKNVDDMTVEKAKEIVAEYFPKDKLQFVLIGKASELKGKIDKYGKVINKDINSDGY